MFNWKFVRQTSFDQLHCIPIHLLLALPDYLLTLFVWVKMKVPLSKKKTIAMFQMMMPGNVK